MPLIQLFTDAFIGTLDRKEKASYGTGLRDFRIEYGPQDLSRYQLAARALICFCTDNSGFNGFVVGITATILFLEKTTGTPRTTAALADLRSRLDDDPSTDGLATWAESFFPDSL